MAKKTLPEPEVPPLADETVAPVEPLPEAGPDLRPVAAPARRGGFVAPLAGGALAAVLGFGLSHYDAFGLRPPETTGELTAALDRQATALAAAEAGLAGRLTKAEAAIAGLPDQFDPGPVNERLTALEESLAAIETLPVTGTSPAIQMAISALEKRVADLAANQPEDLSGKVDAALQQLATAEAEAKAISAKSAALAEAARLRALLDQLATAVNSGVPFDALLDELPDAPTPLARTAATGIVTLAALTESFPDAARATLLEARALSGDDGWGTRLTDFLIAQTGARSLTARAGTDPDAVLSRAEAALRDGRLADALTELRVLDPQVAAPMADWVTQANTRVVAEAALADLIARTAPQEE